MNIKAAILAVAILANGLTDHVPEIANVAIYAKAEANVTQRDIQLCARLVWGEARGIKSKAEQAAVIWCALNRLDAGGFGNSLYEVVTAPHQFTGYRSSNPITDELSGLAADVLLRYNLEKAGGNDVGRTLPKDCLFFAGKGGRNWFRKTYRGSAERWDWSLPDPYTKEGGVSGGENKKGAGKQACGAGRILQRVCIFGWCSSKQNHTLLCISFDEPRATRV